jgi:8-oxo-dGTP pyrophosphatase MutT (NUDIX family)
MVQEPLGIGGGYWLPAGRVDPGESLVAGGLREVLEEGGVQVRITAVLRFSLTNALRVIFLATPVEGADDTPKTVPDFESAGACWVSAQDVETKLTPADCRGGHATEPLEWFPKVAAGERGRSLETEEYKALDAAVVTLCNPAHQQSATESDETATLEGMFFPRWEALRRAYPPELFSETP